MTNIAVIRTGGKQYIVSPGKKIKVEKLPAQEGEDIVFDEVLLLENEQDVQIGTPKVAGAQVKGKVLKQGKAKKVTTVKFKAKKREKTTKGHRQPYTEVEITDIKTK